MYPPPPLESVVLLVGSTFEGVFGAQSGWNSSREGYLKQFPWKNKHKTVFDCFLWWEKLVGFNLGSIGSKYNHQLAIGSKSYEKQSKQLKRPKLFKSSLKWIHKCLVLLEKHPGSIQIEGTCVSVLFASSKRLWPAAQAKVFWDSRGYNIKPVSI